MSRDDIGIALFPYSKTLLPDIVQEGDLEFEENAIITDINAVFDDWWEGSIGDVRGLFPSCFISKRCKFVGTVSFPYQAQREDEISLQVGDTVEIFENKGNGWARVICESSGGFFPLSCIQIKQAKIIPMIKAASGTQIRSSPSKRRKSGISKTLSTRASSSALMEKPEFAVVVTKYDPQHPGDLKLVEGTTIELRKTKGAWWEGVFDGSRGIFPAKCVKKMVQ